MTKRLDWERHTKAQNVMRYGTEHVNSREWEKWNSKKPKQRAAAEEAKRRYKRWSVK